MINTVFFGLNILIAYFIWTYMLKPSIIDHFRDKLFDLRHEVRLYYIANQIPLTDLTYKILRDSINSHLRFTEQKSLIKTIKFIYELDRAPDLSRRIDRAIEKSFFTKDRKLKAFINDSRNKSSMILFEYMVRSSPLMTLGFFILSIFFYLKTISHNLFNNTYIENIARSIEEYSLTHFDYNH